MPIHLELSRSEANVVADALGVARRINRWNRDCVMASDLEREEASGTIAVLDSVIARLD